MRGLGFFSLALVCALGASRAFPTQRICKGAVSDQIRFGQPTGKVKFNGKALFMGYGAVARAVLPIFLDHVQMPLRNISIIDQKDQSKDTIDWQRKGISFTQLGITKENLDRELSARLSPGDLLVDLAWNIDTPTLLQWCHDHGVLYLNTSVELWDPYDLSQTPTPQDRTLYVRHMKIRHLTNRWAGKSPSAAIEHGANPGLISHFVKQGLVDIASACLREGRVGKENEKALERSLADENFAKTAQILGVKVIHCSERDTQISRRPKKVGEFVNTWSVPGFDEEGRAPAEMGWGTHERTLPPNACVHGSGPRNQICLAQMGMNTFVHSWVPYQEIIGMVVRHGEAFTLSDYLTVWDKQNAVYRPTVHYAYCPTDAAIASLWELRANNYKLQSKYRVMNNDIISGADILGALIMGHDFKSWWTGSVLDIHESRRLLPGQNATTLQVAIGVVSALKHIIQNPMRGVITPDHIPYQDVMRDAAPYLGNVISTPADWYPQQGKSNIWTPYRQIARDDEESWQFCNFMVAQ